MLNFAEIRLAVTSLVSNIHDAEQNAGEDNSRAVMDIEYALEDLTKLRAALEAKQRQLGN